MPELLTGSPQTAEILGPNEIVPLDGNVLLAWMQSAGINSCGELANADAEDLLAILRATARGGLQSVVPRSLTPDSGYLDTTRSSPKWAAWVCLPLWLGIWLLGLRPLLKTRCGTDDAARPMAAPCSTIDPVPPGSIAGPEERLHD
jgi:hypothetical protein